jgi:microtubule-associated protein-like 6
MFGEEDIGYGDESISVKMWKKQSKPPTNFIKPKVNANAAPTVTLELDWVHGYRSRDSRNNIGVM